MCRSLLALIWAEKQIERYAHPPDAVDYANGSITYGGGRLMQNLFSSEPVLVIMLGNTAFWNALFPLLNAFHLPVNDVQQHAILGMTTVLAALFVRSQVSPKNG